MILVDIHEPGSIRPRFEEDIHVIHLSSADYAFAGNGPDGTWMIGIERKTVSDLLDSIGSGRLQKVQIPKMKRDYAIRYLLIEGRYRRGSDGNLTGPSGGYPGKGSVGSTRWKYQAVESLLNSLRIFFGVHVLRADDMDGTVDQVEAQYRHWRKPWDKHGTVFGIYGRHIEKQVAYQDPGLVAKMARQINGVGDKAALRAGDKWGYPTDMVQATEQDWLEVLSQGRREMSRATKVVRQLTGS